jgi:hypothetical protein
MRMLIDDVTCMFNDFFLSFSFRNVLREIKKKGIRNIIVDTDPNNMNYFFRFSFSIFNLTIKFNYVIIFVKGLDSGNEQGSKSILGIFLS